MNATYHPYPFKTEAKEIADMHFPRRHDTTVKDFCDQFERYLNHILKLYYAEIEAQIIILNDRDKFVMNVEYHHIAASNCIEVNITGVTDMPIATFQLFEHKDILLRHFFDMWRGEYGSVHCDLLRVPTYYKAKQYDGDRVISRVYAIDHELTIDAITMPSGKVHVAREEFSIEKNKPTFLKRVADNLGLRTGNTTVVEAYQDTFSTNLYG